MSNGKIFDNKDLKGVKIIRKVPRTRKEKKFLGLVEDLQPDANLLVLGHSWGNGITEYGKARELTRLFEKAGLAVRIDSVCVDGAHLDEARFAIDRLIEKRAGKKYESIILIIGANDLYLSPSILVKKLESLYLAAGALSDQVFVCNMHSTPKTKKKVKKINEILAKSSIIPAENIVDINTTVEKEAEKDPRWRRKHPPTYGPVIRAIVEQVAPRVLKRRQTKQPLLH